jgi:hypothetical protein
MCLSKSERIEGFIEALPNLSCGRGRIIQLHARPLPLSRQYKLDRRHIGRLRKRDNLLTGEGGEGAGVEPNHTTARKIGPL